MMRGGLGRYLGRRGHRCAGLSLLEVILAIAILGGCMAVIGELIRLGARQAEEARELTVAQLLCESTLEEIAAGVIAPEPVGDVPFELDPRWSYSIEVSSLDTPELLQVTVMAQQIDGSREIPLSYTLTRWILDPSVELELAELETMDASDTSSGTQDSEGQP
jgi:type II secretory pathway pseudopilin PulG